MKNLKKWATLFMAAVFVMLMMPRQTLFVSATENPGGEVTPPAEDVIASGIRGNVTWVIDLDGKLTISGSGDIYGFGDDDEVPPWYEHRMNITSAEVNVTDITSIRRLFINCENLVSADLQELDTSNIVDMSDIFFGCNNLESVDVSGFNTSNVINMNGMFCGCTKLKNLDVSNFDTAKVEDMYRMFESCNNLVSLDVSNFDTSNVTDMSFMFCGCANLENLDVSNFDTSKVTDMSCMFQLCNSVQNLDVGKFDTSNVTNMSYMFEECSNLKSLDVSNFDTSNVEDMYYMFGSCRWLTNLDLSNFNTSKVTRIGQMFDGCSSLVDVDVSSFDVSNVEFIEAMFNDCTSLQSVSLSNFKTLKADDLFAMFMECNSLQSIDLSNLDTSNIYAMNAMFYGCNSLTDLDLSSFDTSKVEYMNEMFYNCSSLTSLDLSSFNLSNLSDVPSDVFTGCNKLSTINTPYNLTQSIPLPTTGWHLPDGTAITELPKNLSSSVMITNQQSTDNKDDNNQNNNDTTTQDPFWNTNDDQNGAISGVLEGGSNPTDTASYGTRRLTASPYTFNTILLSWDSVPVAKSYEIYYSTSPDSGFKRLANVKKTSYKFSKAKCGVTYYFQMRVCQKGAKSEFGSISYGRTDITAAPTLEVKKTTYNSITLKWTKVPGAKRYEVLYKDSPDGSWQSLGTKSGTSYIHKKLVTGATYYYQIRPLRDSFEGNYSNGISASTPLDDVSRLKVRAASADRMKLSWKKVKGATWYVILRADTIDGTYEVIDRSYRTSYMDTGLLRGTTYFYKVYAVSGSYRTKDTAPVGQTTKIAKK